jgi:hypothetical protein
VDAGGRRGPPTPHPPTPGLGEGGDGAAARPCGCKASPLWNPLAPAPPDPLLPPPPPPPRPQGGSGCGVRARSPQPVRGSAHSALAAAPPRPWSGMPWRCMRASWLRPRGRPLPAVKERSRLSCTPIRVWRPWVGPSGGRRRSWPCCRLDGGLRRRPLVRPALRWACGGALTACVPGLARVHLTGRVFLGAAVRRPACRGERPHSCSCGHRAGRGMRRMLGSRCSRVRLRRRHLRWRRRSPRNSNGLSGGCCGHAGPTRGLEVHVYWRLALDG